MERLMTLLAPFLVNWPDWGGGFRSQMYNQLLLGSCKKNIMGVLLARQVLFLSRSWSAVQFKKEIVGKYAGTRKCSAKCSEKVELNEESVATVYFKAHDVFTEAQPGENIVEVAGRCGVDIPTGCLRGSCGTCEVEVTKYETAQGVSEPSTSVVRACTAGIPRGYHFIEVDDIADAIWGVDGMDL